MMRKFFWWLLMSKVSLILLIVLAIFLHLTMATPSPPAVATPAPTFYVHGDEPVMTDVRAYVVFDAVSGAVLAAQNADTPLPVASITKLPAAAAAEVVVPLEATTTITWSDVNAEGRAGKLVAGEVYSYRELLFPLLLESSNDAAAAIERTYDRQVVTAMNEIAQAYGATTTRFVDTSGLSAENVASARDLALLTTRLYAAHPYIFDISTLSQYVGPSTGWVNNSPVAAQPGYLGGKHGYTEAAGRTIVALFDETFTAGRREIGYVILGSANLASDMETLRGFVRSSVRFE
jgi:D-alanyl-D-alanine carboxypeptidase